MTKIIHPHSSSLTPDSASRVRSRRRKTADDRAPGPVCLLKPAGPATVSSRLAAFGALTALGIVSASAHPGHGVLEEGVAHALASPYHLLILGLVGGGLFGLGCVLSRRLPSRMLQSLGALVAVGALALWGFGS